jgi:trigger factor
LNIESSLQDDHQIKLTVEIDDDTLLAAKKKAARRIARKTKIPGFRPGKAPYQVILKHVGEGSILEDAVDIVIREEYPEFIKEVDIDPYGPGNLENVSSMDPLVLEFVVPLSPEVDIGESLSIRKQFDPPKITEKDVVQVLDNMLERQAEIKEVERPAQVSDLVNIRLRAYQEFGDEPEQIEVFPERSVPIIIHSDENVGDMEGKIQDNPQEEWPYIGFSGNLIGLDKDDTKIINHQFSDEAPEPFQNKDINFSISVEKVQSRKLPELNDEFAKNTGGYPDLKSMRADIFSNLERQNNDLYEQSYDEEILNQAVEKSDFKYPPQALEHEIDEVIKSLKNRLESQNLDLDIYMKTRNIDEQGLRDETIPVAEERLKKSLLLYEIAKLEDIKVDDKKVKSEAQQTLNYLSQTLPYRDARKLSNENIVTNLEWNIRADLLAKSAMEHFRDICSGKMDKDEAIREEEQPAGLDKDVDDNDMLEESDNASNDIAVQAISELDSEKLENSPENNN